MISSHLLLFSLYLFLYFSLFLLQSQFVVDSISVTPLALAI